MSSIAEGKVFKVLFLNQHIMWKITTNIGGIENISTTDENSLLWEVKENITKT